MKTVFYSKVQTTLFAIMSTMIVGLLCYLWIVPNNEIKQKRETAEYHSIEDIQYQEIKDTKAPTGIIREFCFCIDEELLYDSTLVFQYSHQNAEVYLDGEKIYSLQVADHLSFIQTPGTNWAVIPLYREDIGKEVRIILTPVYHNYQHQSIEFLIGSKFAIYLAEFKQSFPEIALSVLDIFAGLGLLLITFYFSLKQVKERSFYELAMLTISLGLWNFTQTDFLTLIMEDRTIFLYYVSLTMLMLCIAPLVQSVRDRRRENIILDIWSIICCCICVIQIGVQILGILDLREMLKITHVLIIISSFALIINELFMKRNHREQMERKFSGAWIIGVGALLDMIFYYVKGSSSGLLFVILAVMCFVLIESMHLFFSYVKQKQMLEEKETQLKLSRITTMLSQIRSHFVFNILNAISGMCKYDPEKADETIIRFAKYLRNNIDIMEDDKPLLFMTELQHLEDYIILEQIRFEDKIEFYTDIKTDQFMIPPLILQPIVENAIKHGLSKKQDKGTLILRTWEEENQIIISVEDDGVGFELTELKKQTSVGIRNIRYRLSQLVDGTLDVQSQPGIGTKVTITIPKKEASLCTSYM